MEGFLWQLPTSLPAHRRHLLRPIALIALGHRNPLEGVNLKEQRASAQQQQPEGDRAPIARRPQYQNSPIRQSACHLSISEGHNARIRLSLDDE